MFEQLQPTPTSPYLQYLLPAVFVGSVLLGGAATVTLALNLGLVQESAVRPSIAILSFGLTAAVAFASRHPKRN